MKKVLFVLNGFRFGGLTKINTVIANALGKNNEVTLLNLGRAGCPFPISVSIVQDKDGAQKINDSLPKALRKLTQLTRLPYNPSLFERDKIEKICSQIEKRNIDVIVLNAYQITFASHIRKKFPNITILGWLHNNADVYIHKFFRSFKKAFLKGIEASDLLICLTESDKKTFQKYTAKAVCVYNPLSLAESGQQASLDVQTISFVGRVDIAQKGIDYLCEIASNLPDGWKIKVAGPGKKSAKKKFEKLQAKHQTGDKLIYVGALKGKKLINHYKNSSIFIMTSRWEGMPLVLAEAMNFGLPIIAFEQSGANEALDFGAFGEIVEQGNVSSFNNVLKNYIDSLDSREKLASLSKERVSAFSLKLATETWEDIITNPARFLSKQI